MKGNRSQLIFFTLFVLFVLGLTVLIFLPYLEILFLALVVAIVFDPFYEKVKQAFGNRATLASLFSVLTVLALILLPIAFFAFLLVSEVSDLSTALLSQGGFGESLSKFTHLLEKALPWVSPESFSADLEVYTSKLLSWLVAHLSVFFSGALKVVFGTLLLILALFYFFRDGKRFISSVINLSPLEDSYDRRIVRRVVTAVNSVVRGHLIIGLLQGILTGLGFAIFGVPSPVLFGAVAAIASLVPTVGTALVLVPGILYLFASGASGSALGLTIWGALAVGLIDNLLGPHLIERGVRIHPFLILLSALGGVVFFGPIGFLAGPVTLSLLFALLDMYSELVQPDSQL
ncbi:AI-2E family transporter [Patescibacteria group bacterium]|nr:MAG: AI-2E family transporter [Patescibacteria group bacterium]